MDEVQGRKGSLVHPSCPASDNVFACALSPLPSSLRLCGRTAQGTGKAVVILVGPLRKWRLGDVCVVTWECSFVPPVGGCGLAQAPRVPS